MEIANEDALEPDVAYWRKEFQKFVYAKTQSEAVVALVDVLRSEFDMPHIFRLVLADMLETGGVRSSIEPAWTIQVVKRRDSKQTKSRLAVYAACKEVQGLVDQGESPTAACRAIATRSRKSQRSIEVAYQNYVALMDKMIGEPKRRAEAAMARSKALRRRLASETRESESDE
jgi:hypothetical protein